MRHIFGILASLAMVTVLACGLGGRATTLSAGAGTGTSATDEPSSGGTTVAGDSDSGGGSGAGATEGSVDSGPIIVSGGTPTVETESGSTDASNGTSETGSGTSDTANTESVSAEQTPNDSVPSQTERLQVVNRCSYTIWLQQQNMTGVPSVIRLMAGESVQFAIPAAGMAATRLWPKMGCDDSGNNCVMGQSSSPCPENGCPPPVDSKFEATWGCTLSDVNACAPNPSAPWERLSNNTYWNTSAVDGYTFPFTATVADNTLPAEICAPVDCSALTIDQCPTSENLSIGVGGVVSPLYGSVDLRLRNSVNALMGCYAPCTKFTYPTYGGFWLSNMGTEAAMYCCPTPPIGPSECSSGPVEATQFVSRVRSMCGGTVYTYAYDDGNGLRQCSGATKVRLNIGPNCP